VGGLRKLGFEPAAVKYVIISHAHADHVGDVKAVLDVGDELMRALAAGGEMKIGGAGGGGGVGVGWVVAGAGMATGVDQHEFTLTR